MRLRGRRDANHVALAAFARSIGMVWVDCAALGGGVGDAFLGIAGQRWVHIEVKDGAKSASRRRLLPGQVAFKRLCISKGLPWALVESTADLLRLREPSR